MEPEEEVPAEHDSQSLSTVEGDKALEMLGNLFSLRRPRDLLAGLSSGLKSLLRGALAGVAVLLLGPIVGVATEGLRSLPRTLLGSLLAGIIFPVVGAVVGTYQIVRGLLCTPVAIYNYLRGRFWDHRQRAWVTWDPCRALASLDERGNIINNSSNGQMLDDNNLANGGSSRGPLRSSVGDGDEERPHGGDASGINERGHGQGASNTRSPEPDLDSDDYFKVLGVSRDASTDDLRRQYYRLAREHHPDKQRDNPEAHDRFQKLSRAYQVLSDPVAREAYCAHGAQGVDERPTVDPSLVFTMLFGSDLFADYVGELLLATIARLGGSMDMNSVLMQRSQLERVGVLSSKLVERLCKYHSSTAEEYRAEARREAQRLVRASYGGILLRSVGRGYSNCADEARGGFQGLKARMRATYHSARHHIAVVRSAASAVFAQKRIEEMRGDLEEAEAEGGEEKSRSFSRQSSQHSQVHAEREAAEASKNNGEAATTKGQGGNGTSAKESRHGDVGEGKGGNIDVEMEANGQRKGDDGACGAATSADGSRSHHQASTSAQHSEGTSTYPLSSNSTSASISASAPASASNIPSSDSTDHSSSAHPIDSTFSTSLPRPTPDVNVDMPQPAAAASSPPHGGSSAASREAPIASPTASSTPTPTPTGTAAATTGNADAKTSAARAQARQAKMAEMRNLESESLPVFVEAMWSFNIIDIHKVLRKVCRIATRGGSYGHATVPSTERSSRADALAILGEEFLAVAAQSEENNSADDVRMNLERAVHAATRRTWGYDDQDTDA